MGIGGLTMRMNGAIHRQNGIALCGITIEAIKPVKRS
jgi:hypothetical protein